jgi:RNA polymerase sigma-70 factor (ECF subfamily)
MASNTHHDEAEKNARFELFFRDNYRWLRRYVARRIPDSRVDDVVATSFIVAWKKYEVDREPSLAWLVQIAHYEISNAVRKSRRAVNEIEIVESDNAPETPNDGFDGSPIRRAMAGLDPSDQELLRLVHWDELGRSEIADVFGLTANAVNVRYHRALKKLAIEMSLIDDPPTHKGVRQ